MSFAVWSSKPPFPEEHLNPDERIYARESGVWKLLSAVGNVQNVDKWAVTNQGVPTQAEVDAVLNPSHAGAAALLERTDQRAREEIAARIESEPLSEGTRELFRALLKLTDKEI